MRPLRIYAPGAWYHLTARGNERRDIFRSAEDRLLFVSRLAEMIERYALRLQAYVLMDNHFHLLVEPAQDNLSRAMQWLGVSYSQWFNRRHRRVGHLFQGRFKAIVVDWQTCGLELSRYVHLNPVRTGRQGLGKTDRQRHRQGAGRGVAAGGVKQRLEVLQDYRWSSYRAYVGMERKPDWLETGPVLGLMGGRKAEQRQGYRRYVEEALLEGAVECPWERVRGQVALGEEAFLEEIQQRLKGDEREQTGLRQLKTRPSWEQAVKIVEEMKKERWETFRDRRGDWGRDVALWLGRRVCGLKLQELAEHAGLNHYGSVSTALRYLQARLAQDAALSRLLSQAKRHLANDE